MHGSIIIRGARENNLRDVSLDIPKNRITVFTGVSAAIIVDQQRIGGNSRSTMGTYTDAYTMLRVLFSRLGTPSAGPFNRYSFNDPTGMCLECEGLAASPPSTRMRCSIPTSRSPRARSTSRTSKSARGIGRSSPSRGSSTST